jgi:Fe-S cluster assembly protein SufD
MMVEVLRENSPYLTGFRGLLERSAQTEPAFIQQAREEALVRFERVGFPSVHDEEWKYTNVAAIAKSEFIPAVAAGPSGSESGLSDTFTWVETRDSRLTFVNGIFQRASSSLNALRNSVELIDLSEAVSGQFEPRIRTHFDRSRQDGENGFVALNTALFSGGLLIRIPAGVTVSVPIDLRFVSASSNGDAPASFPRVLIVAEANSAATVIESYGSQNGGRYFTNALVDLVVESGASIEHLKVQREHDSAFHIATTTVELGPSAKYDATNINLGAAISRHGIEVKMDHEGAECRVDGLYMIGGAQHTDTHSMIDHRQPHCTSNQLYKGILDGRARAVFNGKVFVRHGAQQTVAQQTNKNLLLSNEAQVDTKPQLEIFADDVKCAHGAAVGQLEPDEIFYLESRGIRPELARNLLTYGFAEEIIEKIKIESIKRELDTAVLNRLQTQLEA